MVIPNPPSFQNSRCSHKHPVWVVFTYQVPTTCVLPGTTLGLIQTKGKEQAKGKFNASDITYTLEAGL